MEAVLSSETLVCIHQPVSLHQDTGLQMPPARISHLVPMHIILGQTLKYVSWTKVSVESINIVSKYKNVPVISGLLYSVGFCSGCNTAELIQYTEHHLPINGCCVACDVALYVGPKVCWVFKSYLVHNDNAYPFMYTVSTALSN